jgi:hypothetical protein
MTTILSGIILYGLIDTQEPTFWKSLLVSSSGQTMEAVRSSKTLVCIYPAASTEE